jgi:hypothetical protein
MTKYCVIESLVVWSQRQCHGVGPSKLAATSKKVHTKTVYDGRRKWGWREWKRKKP